MAKLRRFALLLLALVVLAFAACSDRAVTSEPEAASSATVTPPTSPAGTETPAPLPPALHQLLAEVAKTRDLSPPPALKAQLIARSELPALLDRLLTDRDRRWFAETTTLYRLLGHLRKDQDYLTVYKSFGGTAILGLYSPLDDELWVVHDDGKTLDFDNLPAEERTTLAHELVHAVQDFHFHLDEIYDRVVDDLDLSTVWTSVVEGDAVTHEQLWSRQTSIAGPGGRALMFADVSATAPDVPPSIVRELLFPYTTGAEWIRGVRSRSGVRRLDAMITDPPKATAYIFHPELLDSGWQPAEVKLPDLLPALGSGWKRESGGTFGEFQVRNYLQLKLRALDASNAADGWDGDHYDVYVGEGESVAAFRLRFRDGDEAAAFAEAQQSFLKAARATTSTSGSITYSQTPDGNVTATTSVSGSDVLFVIASSRKAAQRAMPALVNA